MKKTFHALGALTIAAALTLFTTACSNDDIAIEPQTEQPAAVKTYQVNIPATMPSDGTRAVTFDETATPPTAITRFEASENIYVYNETKGAMLTGALHPSDISADGKHCSLTGTLTGTIEANDLLTLAYNMNNFSTNNIVDHCYFRHSNQNGTPASVIDGGMATHLKVTSFSNNVLTTEQTASFAMQQAIFRLKFTDGTNPIIVKSLNIESTGWDIATYYFPFREGDSRYLERVINVSPSTPTSDYLYVAIAINENRDPSSLKFTVIDNEDYQYTATKDAPNGGFKNGKYYYSAAATALTKQVILVKPTVTWTTVRNGAVEPDQYYRYDVYGPWNKNTEKYEPSEITISGTSTGYYFYMNWGATIHLNGITAAHERNSPFIEFAGGDLNLDISGTNNTITCKNYNQCISGGGNTLKLSGNGTLTVTAESPSRYGIYASNYNDDNNSDASVLAATGYTVIRSDRTNNADGTYTWTYTVAPNQ